MKGFRKIMKQTKTELLPITPSPEVLADFQDLEFIKVVCLEVAKKDGSGTFPTIIGYHKLYNAEAKEFVDVLVPSKDKEGNPIMVSKAFRVVLAKQLRAKLDADGRYPFILAVSHSEQDYSVGYDKDKEGNVRTYKEKKQKVVFINDYRELLSGIVPMSLADLEDDD